MKQRSLNKLDEGIVNTENIRNIPISERKSFTGIEDRK